MVEKGTKIELPSNITRFVACPDSPSALITQAVPSSIDGTLSSLKVATVSSSTFILSSSVKNLVILDGKG